MKKILTTALALSMTLAMTAADSATKTVWLKVIETSDVHGHFFPWDFMEGKPIKGTLAREGCAAGSTPSNSHSHTRWSPR